MRKSGPFQQNVSSKPSAMQCKTGSGITQLSSAFSEGRFLCFDCGGDSPGVDQCKSCNKSGKLTGGHPMIILIQRIIDLKLCEQTANQALDYDRQSQPGTSICRKITCDDYGKEAVSGARPECLECNDFGLCVNCNFDKEGKDNQLLCVEPESDGTGVNRSESQLRKAFKKEKLRQMGRGFIASVSRVR